jgi:phosphatidylinositol alpha-1,6-mannosyltransferase
MSRPRVLLGVESLIPGNGGISRVARLVARVLAEEQSAGRLDADAVVLSDDRLPNDLGLAAVAVGKSRPKFVWHIQKAALTHTHFIYDRQGMSRAHCRLPLLKRPMMTFIHGIEVWETGSELRARTARRADYLISNTAYTRERANRSHGGFERAKVCWLATEQDEAPSIEMKDGPPVVMIVGRIEERRYKGHAELIECWHRVVEAVPEARLWIVGKGSGLEAHQKMARQSPAAARIEFKGFVPEARMLELWSQADVLAMPSRYEGFGLVYIEAMRYGVPVIGSVHDAAPEVNVDGKTGFNVNLDQDGALAERLIQLLKEPELARRMGQGGRERWNEHYRYSAFRRRFLGHLHEFLDIGDGHSSPAKQGACQ